MTRHLVGWMNGQRVGQWRVTDAGVHYFDYDAEWMRSEEGRPLSLSMPFTPSGQIKGAMVEAYFDNLLPDSDIIRQRIQTRFKTRTRRTLDLLAEIGRDCVGALQLLREGDNPDGHDRIQGARLTETDVERHLGRVSSTGIGAQNGSEEFRISVAGAQEKTALLWHEGQWQTPLGSTPSTHLLKLPLGIIGGMRNINMSDSVENEWLCSRILAAFGLPIAQTSIGQFGDTKALIVTRFDRKLTNQFGQCRILRLPQEDFCQATATPSAQKYEADGGPGLRRILDLLQGSSDPVRDRTNVLRAQFVFWILAAIDGHAKNFSLFLRRGGAIELTPFYDVLSAWPVIGNGPSQIDYEKAKLAMALRSKNTHYQIGKILPRHWKAETERAGLDDGWRVLQETAADVPRVLAQVECELPNGFPEYLWLSVRNGVMRHVERFQALSAELK